MPNLFNLSNQVALAAAGGVAGYLIGPQFFIGQSPIVLAAGGAAAGYVVGGWMNQ